MTPISEADLRNMAPHVQWEFDMLCLAAEKSRMSGANKTTGISGTTTTTVTIFAVNPASVRSQQHKTVESLIFEASLVHFRILLHFLFANRQKGDFLRVFPGDVLALDYGPSWQPTRPSWLHEYWTRCNKLLAHLSVERPKYIESRTIEWPGLRLKIEHVEVVYVMFLRCLTLDRQEWFQQSP
jgi:hypothetical protein